MISGFQTKLITLACLCGILGNCYANTPTDLFTVAQSAINRNLSLQMDQQQMMADIAESKEALALWLPQVGFEAADSKGSYNTKENGDGSAETVSSNFDTASKYWMIGVKQSLFNLSNIEKLNEANIGKKIASLNYAIAQQKLLKKTINAYFNVLLAQDMQKVAISNLTAAKAELSNAKKLKAEGMAITAEIEEADADKQNALLKLTQARNNSVIALENLNHISNNSYSSLLPLNSRFIKHLPKTASQDYWINNAIQYNPNLQALQLQARMYHHRELSYWFKHIPRIDAYANHVDGYSKNAGIAGMQTNIGSSVVVSGNSSYNVGYNYHGNIVGIQLDEPIFTGGYIDDKKQQAAHLMEKYQLALDDGRQQIRLAIIEAYQQLEEDKEGINLAQAELTAAKSGLTNMENEINNGFNSPLNISQARDKYTTAQENILSSEYRYIDDLVNLKYLAGDLNEKTVIEINQWL